jgi:CHASE2 domain-containing sensor protein
MKGLLPDTRFDSATTLQRSAVMVWWAALFLAVLLGLLAAWLGFARHDPIGFIVAVLAAVCLVAGRSAFFFMVDR